MGELKSFLWLVRQGSVGLLLVALGAFEPPALHAQEPHKLIVPFSPIGGSTVPFWIATDERLFQKYGLEVTPLFVGGSSAIVQAMTAKQHDIGLIGGGGVVLNRFAGGDLIAIGAHGGVLAGDCFARPEIKKHRRLEGQNRRRDPLRHDHALPSSRSRLASRSSRPWARVNMACFPMSPSARASLG